MLTVLLILGIATFVLSPLLLWLAAKIVRARGASLPRAFAAYGLIILVAVAGQAAVIFLSARGPVILVIGLAGIALDVWLVKLVLRTGAIRALGCFALTSALTVAAALGIRAVAVEAFRISGGAMAPTLLAGDRVLVDKTAFLVRDPARAQVVVFPTPGAAGTSYVKRVAGVQGDRLERAGDVLLVNGTPAGACPMLGPPSGGMKLMEFPATVPPGKLFVLGDNRLRSMDSRHYGFVDARKVVGLVTFIYASENLPPGDDVPPWGEQGTHIEPAIRWDRVGKAIK